MAKQIGSIKTGGRSKGTPNKKTKDLQEALSLKGINVVERISEILPQMPVEKQADLLMGLMVYLYPKRKAIELIEEPNVEEVNEKLKITFVGTKCINCDHKKLKEA